MMTTDAYGRARRLRRRAPRTEANQKAPFQMMKATGDAWGRPSRLDVAHTA